MFGTGAHVLRFRESSVYDCVAQITNGALTLKCNKQEFGGSMMRGDTVTRSLVPQATASARQQGAASGNLIKRPATSNFAFLPLLTCLSFHTARAPQFDEGRGYFEGGGSQQGWHGSVPAPVKN